jgi:hypothetical protein
VTPKDCRYIGESESADEVDGICMEVIVGAPGGKSMTLL